MSSEIECQQNGAWGVITLTREKALNALTGGMVQAMYEQLKRWLHDDTIKAIMVQGAGERAFCAGGDVVWVHDTAKQDIPAALLFFHAEYRLNALIKAYPKPYIAMIDGIVMGGGVGLSAHGDYCVAGDKTLFAMPETGIGMLPDVGGGYFLPRLADGLGYYYGLTGIRAKAADCLAAGVATHYTPSDQQASLQTALLGAALEKDADADIKAILEQYHQDLPDAPLNNIRTEIKKYFDAPDSLSALIKSLSETDNAFAEEILSKLAHMSPMATAIAFEQIKRGATLSFRDNMIMEYRIVARIMEGHDFFEGIRAQLIDKDRSPKWLPAEHSAVSQDDVLRYFAPLGDLELIFEEGVPS